MRMKNASRSFPVIRFISGDIVRVYNIPIGNLRGNEINDKT